MLGKDPSNFSSINRFTPDRNKSYKKRQGSFLIDDSVKKVTKDYPVVNNQFRKHVFNDGSVTIAPKAYIPDNNVKDNGAKKQGLNTVFRPDASTETSGFIRV